MTEQFTRHAPRILDELAQTGIALLLKEPFYAHLFSSINKEIVGPAHEVQTLAVGLGKNSLSLYINAQFWDETLTRPEHRYGVLKHEMLHLVFRHLQVQEPQLDPLLLNIAFDLVVNQYIDREQLPDDSIFIESFPELALRKGETWYYYYKSLENTRKSEGEQSTKGRGNSALEEIQSNSNGLERHQPWREVRSRSQMENAVLDTHLDSLLKTAHQRTNAAAWGNLPDTVRETISSFFPKPPSIHWRMALRRFSQSARSTRLKNTLKRPSKRYGTTPGLRIERRHSITAAIDTSGSVGQPEFQLFFNELHQLWKAGAQITVLEADTEIHRIYTYKGRTPEWTQGRGGTDFTAAIHWANQHQPDLLIYLTDGFAGPSKVKPTLPIIWLISPDGLRPSHQSWNTLPGKKIKMQS